MTSYRLLILDDMVERHRTYAAVYRNNDITHVYKADDAIRELQGPRFDYVFLDHDLDEQATLGLTPIEKTGQDVVEHMVTMPKELHPQLVVIHSWNITGAERMYNRLKDAGFNVIKQPFKVPGGWTL